MKEKIFLASTKTGYRNFRDIVEYFRNNNSKYDIKDWIYDFDNSESMEFLDTLENIADKYSFAVFYIDPADIYQDKNGKLIKSKNIFFEMGYFIGKFSIYNCLILFPDIHEPGEILPNYLHSKYQLIYETQKLLIDNPNRMAYCNILYKKIEGKVISLKELAKRNEKYHVYADRTDCYLRGIKMIENTKSDIWSIISYQDELEKEGTLEYKMRETIEKKIKKESGKIEIYRYMNLGNDNIRKQAEILIENTINRIKIYDTYCKYIEAIITGDEVLLVLPSFKDDKLRKIQVDFGIYIKDKDVAKEFRGWCKNLVPEPNRNEITTKKDLEAYLDATLRVAGSRLVKCGACDV